MRIEFRDLDGRHIDTVKCGQGFDICFYLKISPGFAANKSLLV